MDSSGVYTQVRLNASSKKRVFGALFVVVHDLCSETYEDIELGDIQASAEHTAPVDFGNEGTSLEWQAVCLHLS